MTVDVPIPCTPSEWEASLEALNTARTNLEAARAAFDRAQVRVRDNLLSQGVIPSELP